LQQTITDKIFNHRYITLAGVLFLLLIIVNNFLKADLISNATIPNDELLCGTQANIEYSAFIIEDTNEEDFSSELCSYPFNCNFTVYSFRDNRMAFAALSHRFTQVSNYFQSDLSPPLLI